mmetsp:Transcript_46733/g.131960  ORF Transcript_46733/g.131960 Transcript_46733/m.131960 type:complete len:103 (-) Transcript_46733:128-436(-)
MGLGSSQPDTGKQAESAGGPLAVDAEELQKKKDLFAKENPDKIDGGQPCTNPLCRCPMCTCGPGCTCNVSMEKVCDDCKTMKKKMEEAAASGTAGRCEGCAA